ncbi:MAG TPA: hypothetical protein PLI26_08860 [Bacillota bacterium]|nr:hypothetical protein [Bacillota bacterium]
MSEINVTTCAPPVPVPAERVGATAELLARRCFEWEAHTFRNRYDESWIKELAAVLQRVLDEDPAACSTDIPGQLTFQWKE